MADIFRGFLATEACSAVLGGFLLDRADMVNGKRVGIEHRLDIKNNLSQCHRWEWRCGLVPKLFASSSKCGIEIRNQMRRGASTLNPPITATVQSVNTGMADSHHLIHIIDPIILTSPVIIKACFPRAPRSFCFSSFGPPCLDVAFRSHS
jgi:hypothetical protein